MNVVDSSGWLEYFADDPNADFFASVIEQTSDLVVPTIILYEVFKRIHQQRDEDSALQAIALMQQGKVIDLTSNIALSACHISLELDLPLADSVILASARYTNSVLWTQDSDFSNIPDVKFIPKQK